MTIDGMTPLVLFLALVFLHCLGDYPLQGDFMARAKNHRAPIAGVPSYLILATHAFIHAGLVAAMTGSLVLGLSEFIMHAAIDHSKSESAGVVPPAIAFSIDQALHVLCKLAWVLFMLKAYA